MTESVLRDFPFPRQTEAWPSFSGVIIIWLPSGDLVSEMSLLYPVAAVINGGDPDPRLAWKQAILREKRLCGPKACRSASKLLCRYFAFNFSTSGVERLSLALTVKSTGDFLMFFSKHLSMAKTLKKSYFNLFLMRFARSIWMSGTQRADVSIAALVDELRVSYLEPADENTALHMAQLEWVT